MTYEATIPCSPLRIKDPCVVTPFTSHLPPPQTSTTPLNHIGDDDVFEATYGILIPPALRLLYPPTSTVATTLIEFFDPPSSPKDGGIVSLLKDPENTKSRPISLLLTGGNAAALLHHISTLSGVKVIDGTVVSSSLGETEKSIRAAFAFPIVSVASVDDTLQGTARKEFYTWLSSGSSFTVATGGHAAKFGIALPCPTVIDKVEEWVRRVMEERDATHGFKHALDVMSRVTEILRFERPPYHEEDGRPGTSLVDVCKVAALVHDVEDHKYDDYRPGQVRDFLKTLLDPVTSQWIVDIVECVSYSREVKGVTKEKMDSMSRTLRWCRDAVSDADKIEAIGKAGIERCYQYAVERGSSDPWKHVKQHVDEKLSKLWPVFIKTKGGKKVGEKGHWEIIRWREENP